MYNVNAYYDVIDDYITIYKFLEKSLSSITCILKEKSNAYLL